MARNNKGSIRKRKKFERMKKKYPKYGDAPRDKRKIRMTIFRDSYYRRGRRVNYAQCPMCGEFNKKIVTHRTVIRKVAPLETQDIMHSMLSINCKNHGKQILDEIEGKHKVMYDGRINY